MTKVIEFPRNKIVREPTLIEQDLEEIKQKGRRNYADAIVAGLSSDLHIELENYGVDSSSPPFRKDFYFLMDVLRSVVYRNMNLEHGLHEFIDQTVKVYKKNEDGTMMIAEKDGKIDDETWNEYFEDEDEDDANN
jgi:hypothetical protein